MKELVELLLRFGSTAIGLIICFGIWLAIHFVWISLKERREVIRARRQGYRVKVFVGGGHGSREVPHVQYTAEGIDYKFEADWRGDIFVVKIPITLSNIYPSQVGYWEPMKGRVVSELKRLLRNKVEIVT